jgi:hypothetical protein
MPADTRIFKIDKSVIYPSSFWAKDRRSMRRRISDDALLGALVVLAISALLPGVKLGVRLVFAVSAVVLLLMLLFRPPMPIGAVPAEQSDESLFRWLWTHWTPGMLSLTATLLTYTFITASQVVRSFVGQNPKGPTKPTASATATIPDYGAEIESLRQKVNRLEQAQTATPQVTPTTSHRRKRHQ